MALVKSVDGLVFRDDFSGSLGSNWTTFVSCGITSGRLRAPPSGSAANRPGAVCIAAAGALELFSQATHQFNSAGTSEPNHVHFDAGTPGTPPNYTAVDLHIGDDDTELYRVNAGTFNTLELGASSRSASTDYQLQLYSAPDVQHGAAIRNGGTIDLRSGTYNGFNATARRPGFWRNGTASTSQWSLMDDFMWMRSKYLYVRGPTTITWKVRVVNTVGVRVHTADFSPTAGVAALDCIRAGVDGFSSFVPWAGWARLILVDANGKMLDYIHEGIYPGSDYTWNANIRTYPLAVTTQGPQASTPDTFTGSPGTVIGTGYTEVAGDWSRASDRVEVTHGPAAFLRKEGYAADEMFIQVANKELAAGSRIGIIAKFEHTSGEAFRGYILAYENVFGERGLYRANNQAWGSFVTLDSDPATSSSGTDRLMQLMVRSGRQEAAMWTGTAWATHSANDTVFDGVTSRVVAIFHDSFGGAVAFASDDLCIFRRDYIRIVDASGLAAGWKAKIVNSAGSIVASATSSGGVADIPCSIFDGASERVPTAGWRHILITDASDVMIHLYDYFFGDTLNAPFPGLQLLMPAAAPPPPTIPMRANSFTRYGSLARMCGVR